MLLEVEEVVVVAVAAAALIAASNFDCCCSCSSWTIFSLDEDFGVLVEAESGEDGCVSLLFPLFPFEFAALLKAEEIVTKFVEFVVVVAMLDLPGVENRLPLELLCAAFDDNIPGCGVVSSADPRLAPPLPVVFTPPRETGRLTRRISCSKCFRIVETGMFPIRKKKNERKGGKKNFFFIVVVVGSRKKLYLLFQTRPA